MKCDSVGPGIWQLSFGEHEAIFIINILARVGRHYQEDPARMPPALRAYWEGRITRGDPAAKEGLTEAQELLAELRAELRSERLGLVENWIREYELAEERDPWIVEITGAERDDLIAMLNDRRMVLAHEFAITETDMDMEPADFTDEARRQAMLEIDVLGHVILVIIGPQIYRP